MTYRELLNILNTMSDDDLDRQAVVYNAADEEYHEVADVDSVTGEVLDEGSPVIVINLE